MGAIGRAIGTHLKEVKCPIPVVDGPEPTTSTTASRERVVIERVNPDAFGPPKSQHQNPRHHFTRMVGGKITIYAQSTKPGATQEEHDVRCDSILSPVLVGLRKAAAVRKVALQLKGGEMKPIEDLAKGNQPGAKGTKYELAFAVGTGIAETTFAGEAAPELAIAEGGITSTTNVTLANAPEEDAPPPEVACGGDE